MTLLGTLLLLGVVLMCAGSIWIIIIAFRTHLGWGLLCLLCAPAQWVFVALHWTKGWKALTTQLVGIATMLVIGPAWERLPDTGPDDPFADPPPLWLEDLDLSRLPQPPEIGAVPTLDVAGGWQVTHVKEHLEFTHHVEYRFRDSGLVTISTQYKDMPDSSDTFDLPYAFHGQWLILYTEEGAIHSHYFPFIWDQTLILEPPDNPNSTTFYRMYLRRIVAPDSSH